jgi:sulfatase maturation enzyme AslB (radical SAM superfamily)
MWKHFKLIIIGASIDGMGDVNNLIRRFVANGGKLKKILKSFGNAEGNFCLHVTCTVQVRNIWQFQVC